MLTPTDLAFPLAIVLHISTMLYMSKDQGSLQIALHRATKQWDWEQGSKQPLSRSGGVRRRVGRGKILGESDRLPISRNIHSPWGGKSGANIAAISHSMLIAGETHLMLLEMNGSPHRSEGNYLHSAQEMPIFQPVSVLFGDFCCSVVLLPLERIHKSHSQRQNTFLADKQPIDHGKSSVAKLLELRLAASWANAYPRWGAPDNAAVSVHCHPSKDPRMFRGHLKHSTTYTMGFHWLLKGWPRFIYSRGTGPVFAPRFISSL